MPNAINEWALIVLVSANPQTMDVVPVPTNLVFPSLSDCFQAEVERKKQWREFMTESMRRGVSLDELQRFNDVLGRATCVPHRSSD